MNALVEVILNPPALVWPMAFVLVSLVIIRQFFTDIKPIFSTVVFGVAKQAQGNAGAYALAIGFGLSASLQALADQATDLGWVYVAAFAKVVNPFIVACVAYATQTKFVKPDATGKTNPPFIPPTP